ncbi:MAG: 4-alpha-glucanotransferase [Lachnospiraceae bacterium]|nr:4-alpha-glucanotransferase [Lachnospiraceae bacterium]
MFDVIRIDHFIGIVRYYSIPVNKSAKLGKYVWGPGEKLVQAIDEARGESKIIAEDLGVVIPEVRELLKKSGYTGMKIIEFAFGGGAGNEHLPHNYEKDFAVYGGTHDNETLCGYFAGLKGRDLRYALDYCGVKTKEELVESVYRLAMESVANLCVFQMQDILKLDNAARMNFPSTLGTNWRWRMREGEYTKELREKWKRLTVITRRERVTMNILTDYLKKKYNKNIDKCSDEDIYRALLSYCKEIGKAKERMAAPGEGKRKLYYISAEFLIGKLLGNNLINLGIYDEIREELAQHGKDLAKIEELEAEASLGNGGLGRLAACFLDSISTLGLNGDGVGLNYHLGLFKQVFEKRLQDEEPNPWISKDSWLTRTDKSYTVDFGDFSVEAQMYDIDVMGYDNRTNKLHLFDLDSVNEDIVKKGISFDKKDIKRNLTLFLYPDDSDKAGNLLRVYQQYFMVSSAAQMIIEEAKERGSNLHDLNEYVAIQINDTHPSMVIPELIRLLELEGIDKKEAAGIVSKTCAYTNHTILAEALEKWPLAFIKKVAPQIVPVIKFLDAEVKKKYKDESVYIIDKENRVHMAHMDIHYGYSVNGVAYLHTEILKNTELNNFYKIYPEKFNNKTNGITFRRWLLHCNRDLAAFIEDKIGDEFKKDADKLEKLADFKNDMESLTELLDIKRKNKVRLAEYVENVQGIKIDPDSIFDIQVKRLHEYKRQQLNALYAIHEYLEIKKGHIPATPITMIFGAKAAPAYTIAKDIIHLILCLQELTTKDPQVSPYLKVIMLENYNVSYAEKVIPAADISEQISLASKEASGTGNMKFMLNGAVTLGTMDGANVEIRDLVGEDNIYIFGDDSDTVIERYKKASYKPGNYLKKDKELKACVDFIVGKEMMKIGHKKNLERLYNELVTKDWFMTFPDYEEYVKIKNKALKDYDNRYLFAQKMLINISKAGFFSSDRTIAEYNKDIWHL